VFEACPFVFFQSFCLQSFRMSVTVRSFAKINLGLAIGPSRSDGFHELRTIYQTIALHDILRVQVVRGTGIEIRCEDPRVPIGQSNTCYGIVERAIAVLKARGQVIIEIEKRLPIQGGLGGASGNAVATLLALEHALKKQLSGPEKLRIAAEVGSDLPLFLIGGTVLGVGHGEEVYPAPDLPSVPCVIATPEIGVSTPQAFADWDQVCSTGLAREKSHLSKKLLSEQKRAEQGSAWTGEGARPYANAGAGKPTISRSGADELSKSNKLKDKLTHASPSDRMIELGQRLSAWLSGSSGVPVSKGRGRAETPLLDLVRTGIENDFEQVVFPKYPELREVKSELQRAGAFYASLSGSGSSIYGLFESRAIAEKAVGKLAKRGIPSVVTTTLTRRQYWKKFLVSGL
jgi:4-diphosphocytidyl-2-C-methyl-D-erythritol kinase